MNVHKIMQTNLVTVQADEPLINAIEAASSQRIHHLPVIEDGQLVGIIADVDIKQATPSPLVPGSDKQYAQLLHETPVRRIMRRAPITVSPSHKLKDVVRLMIDKRIGALPVVSAGKLVGIVTECDVLRAFQQILETLE